jgi:outer membrane protein
MTSTTLRTFVAGLLWLVPLVRPAWATEALTLPQAIHEALAHNPGQAAQRLDVQRAEKGQEAARGARLPALDFSASATRFGYPSLVVPIREAGVFPPLDETIYDYGVALKLPLYAGGRLDQGIALADLGREISVERERLGAQGLIFNVGSVYLKILHLHRLDDAYGARIASLESQERRVRLRVDVGKAPRLDMLKIGVQLSKARHDRLRVRNARHEAYTLLYNLMGRGDGPAETPLRAYVAVEGFEWRLDALQRSARESRPELRIAEREAVAAAAQAGLARSERLPDVALVGGYRERAGADTDFHDDWSVGLRLSVPLFDGGVRRSRVAQAVLATERARRIAEQERLDVDRQVQDAWNRHDESRSRLAVTERSVQESDEALAIEKLRYDQGVGTITDLLNAESALLTAQADRLQAEFDLIVARVSLLRAGGRLDAERLLALVRARDDTVKESFGP